jgi:DNA-binding NarL/FixJ family response regulator
MLQMPLATSFIEARHTTLASLGKALVVESHFASRVGLLSEMKAASFSRILREAKSIEDGLAVLQNEHIDACVVGSNVSRLNAIRFLTKATACSKEPTCVFVVLRRPGSPYPEQLHDFGADAVMCPGSNEAVLVQALKHVIAAKAAEKQQQAQQAKDDEPRDSEVLIVDESSTRQTQLRQILRSLGYSSAQIHVCDTLEAASDATARHRYRTVFVCLTPWDQDGLHFLRCRQHSGSQAHVVAYAEEATRELIIKVASGGAISFLAYPFCAEAVESALLAQAAAIN